ncbi:MAG: glycosyltransferase family 2 protein [Candidatus Margulisbacteria bacterium]|nr:glycosyltransferase family 2 protein [Candidatus Margulisiibacteriota bacterium]
MKKIFVVIVNWKAYADTAECLLSISKIKQPHCEVVLVDNESEANAVEKLKQDFPFIKVIQNNENLGCTEGNNAGIHYALDNGADYIFRLDNDAFIAPDAIEKLLERAESDPTIGVVAPKIYFAGHPNIIWFAGGFLNKLTGFAYHRGVNQIDKGQFNRQIEIDYAAGCAMLIKRAVFEITGFFDKLYAHGQEDVDFCLFAKTKGFKVIFEPSAIVYNKLSRSSGGSRSPLYLYYRSRNHLIFKKCLNIKAPWFWPFYIYLVLRRILGSIVLEKPRGALATINGIYDYYIGKWGRGSGDRFR